MVNVDVLIIGAGTESVMKWLSARCEPENQTSNLVVNVTEADLT